MVVRCLKPKNIYYGYVSPSADNLDVVLSPFITPFIAYTLTATSMFLKLYYQHLLLQYDQYINTLILVTHSQSTESNISDYSGLKRDVKLAYNEMPWWHHPTFV